MPKGVHPFVHPENQSNEWQIDSKSVKTLECESTFSNNRLSTDGKRTREGAAVWTLGVRMLGRAEGLHFHCREENAVNCKSFWASLLISSIFPPFLSFSIYTNNILLIWSTSATILTPQAPPFCLFCLSLYRPLLCLHNDDVFFLLFSCMACLLPPSQSPQTANPTRLWFCAWNMKMWTSKRMFFYWCVQPTQPLSRHFICPIFLSFSLSLFPSVFVSVSLFSVCETSVTSLCCSVFHTCKSTVSVQWYYHREQAWYFVVYGTIVHVVLCLYKCITHYIHPSIYIYIHSLATLLGTSC